VSGDREYLVRRLYAILRHAGPLDRDSRLRLFRYILWRPAVQSTDDLDEIDLRAVIQTLEYWLASDRLVEQMAHADEPSEQ
jgi:hypothetical protein